MQLQSIRKSSKTMVIKIKKILSVLLILFILTSTFFVYQKYNLIQILTGGDTKFWHVYNSDHIFLGDYLFKANWMEANILFDGKTDTTRVIGKYTYSDSKLIPLTLGFKRYRIGNNNWHYVEVISENEVVIKYNHNIKGTIEFLMQAIPKPDSVVRVNI